MAVERPAPGHRPHRSAREEAPQRREIFLLRARDDLGRKARRRRLLIPFDRDEVVAHELLVVARRRLVGRVALGRPVARRVGREHLVDQPEAAGGVGAELELGVGEDHPGLFRAIMTELVELEAERFHLLVERGADDGDALGVVDGFVVLTLGSLGGRSEDGGGEAVGLAQAGGELEAADVARFLIRAPAAADEVAADDALDRDGLQFPHDHAAELEVRVGEAAAGEFAGLVGEEVVADDAAGLGEPPVADLGEDGALAGDAVGQDHVERGEAVGGGEEEGVAEVEDFTDLAGGDAGERQVIDGGDRGLGEGRGDGGEGHAPFFLHRSRAKVAPKVCQRGEVGQGWSRGRIRGKFDLAQGRGARSVPDSVLVPIV